MIGIELAQVPRERATPFAGWSILPDLVGSHLLRLSMVSNCGLAKFLWRRAMRKVPRAT
jgi:hypothetical protein